MVACEVQPMEIHACGGQAISLRTFARHFPRAFVRHILRTFVRHFLRAFVRHILRTFVRQSVN